jgi:hypothetical protein
MRCQGLPSDWCCKTQAHICDHRYAGPRIATLTVLVRTVSSDLPGTLVEPVRSYSVVASYE